MQIEKVVNESQTCHCYFIKNALDQITRDSFRLQYELTQILQEENPKPSNVINGFCKGSYCDVIGISLLNAFIPVVRDVLDRDIYPTYAYTREYSKGAELISHRDRDECEISVSVTLKQDALLEKFYVSTKDKKDSLPQDIITISMAEGDAILFFGTETDDKNWHWRDPILSESTIQFFLHYCYKDGNHSHLAYEWIKKGN